MFVITCMPVGGAETLLVELIRRMDRTRFAPELCCLKYRGPMGDVLAGEVPTYAGLLAGKYDFAVLKRLTRLLRRRQIDAVVTVGTGGDKMFWGRLAGWLARVPVICSALHSTGLPDRVELPNRLLAPITDAFIAVARSHGAYLAEHEGCPARKVRVIPNGVDVERFRPRPRDPVRCEELGIPGHAPVAGIVAALRPEKNHRLFLDVARRVHGEIPAARFLIVGDGPEREDLERYAAELGIAGAVRFAGTRHDVPEMLSLMDVFILTSTMEANPVSILEALACRKPVVATDVGSVSETVLDGQTGYLAPPGDARTIADRVAGLLQDPAHADRLGRAGREYVTQHWLTFARGGAPVRERTDVGPTVRNAATLAASGSNVRCEFDITGDACLVDADLGQLSQVMNNLVLNACQAMPGGRGRGGWPGCRRARCRYELAVAPGLLRAHHRPRRGRGNRARAPRPGLRSLLHDQGGRQRAGLASCYSIVRNHGGHIAVSSAPGAGAAFAVYLPASPSPAAGLETRGGVVPGGTGRILVMDDEDAVRDLASLVLGELGYDVTAVGRGEEALATYEAALHCGEPFAAAILDLTIKTGLGGSETMRRLLLLDPATRAIACSGYSADPVMAHPERFGFREVLAKPYGVEDLARVVAQVLSEP